MDIISLSDIRAGYGGMSPMWFHASVLSLYGRRLSRRGLRVGGSVYFCGSESPHDGPRVFRAWIADADGPVQAIGDDGCRRLTDAEAIRNQAAACGWTACLLATVAVAMQDKKDGQTGASLSRGAGVLTMRGNQTMLRWKSAAGIARTEGLYALAQRIGYRVP